MKKKLVAILCSIAMLATVFTGCSSTASNEGSSDTSTSDTTEATEAPADTTEAEATEAPSEPAIALDGTWPAEEIIIGVETFDTTSDQFLNMQAYFDYLTEYYNVSFIYSEAIASAEDELNFINSCASAGAKAFIGYYNVSVDEAVKACIDNGMYYWAPGTQFSEAVTTSEYYLGGYSFVAEGDTSGHNGDYLAGYQMGYTVGTQGSKHVLYCNGGVDFGIPMFIDRQNGFLDGIAAAQAEGSTIQFDQAADIIAGWPGTDAFTAAQTAALDKDYDAIAVSFAAATWFQPIATAGKTDAIKLATIGEVTDTYYDAVQGGQVSCIVYDCEEVVFGNAIPTIINAVLGHTDIAKNNGAPASVFVNRWTITDAASFSAIYDYHAAGNYFVSAEEMAQCFPEFNANASYQTLVDLYSPLDLETGLTKIQ